jgi:hypothetical protein
VPGGRSLRGWRPRTGSCASSSAMSAVFQSRLILASMDIYSMNTHWMPSHCLMKIPDNDGRRLALPQRTDLSRPDLSSSCSTGVDHRHLLIAIPQPEPRGHTTTGRNC